MASNNSDLGGRYLGLKWREASKALKFYYSLLRVACGPVWSIVQLFDCLTPLDLFILAACLADSGFMVFIYQSQE